MFFIDLIIIVLILFIGHNTVSFVVNKYRLFQFKSTLLYLFYYHILFSILFGLYVTNFGGDAIGYWRPIDYYTSNVPELSFFFTPGTKFVKLLTYPFVSILNLSFWTGCLLFSLFGFFGFLFLFLIIIKTAKSNAEIFGYKMFPFLLFLPNMHFWSSGIGKDSIMFFCMTLFAFSLLNIKRNIPGLAVSLFLAFYVRPHMSILMVSGLGIGLLTSVKGVSFFWRILFISISVILFIYISPVVLEFVQVESLDIENLDQLSDGRATTLSRQKVGSAIDISNYSMPLKLFTFFFRPLFIDAPNIFGFFNSFENLVYLLLFISLININSLIEIFSS